jgi:hypothetical protein
MTNKEEKYHAAAGEMHLLRKSDTNAFPATSLPQNSRSTCGQLRATAATLL